MKAKIKKSNAAYLLSLLEIAEHTEWSYRIIEDYKENTDYGNTWEEFKRWKGIDFTFNESEIKTALYNFLRDDLEEDMELELNYEESMWLFQLVSWGEEHGLRDDLFRYWLMKMCEALDKKV